MDLQFVGIDPNTQGNGSPTVWVDADQQEIVIQGWKADEDMSAKISETEWVPSHETGIPEHETSSSARASTPTRTPRPRTGAAGCRW
ncbi:hypothetical protein [Streptomyces sp. NPDC094032]|uniref:hypothetical protein n=1 Tax=Streptomyces sp. NPDC094032 TaxID=3155308 RepID=UPI00331BA604